jgi:transglutaminase-like putative cysteine protease
VDFHTPGIYTATYIATDASGNTTRQSIAVTVLTVEYEMLNDMLQAVVDRIIREDMTQREMAQAIFTWVSNNIGYVADAPKDTVYDGAFRALQFRSGDCFTYYAISEVLLTRLGIPNIGLERVEGTSTRHYWNLVNADGEGWYHFDTTPTQVRRLDRFMFGEQAAMEYTEIMLNETRTRNYYTYDREALPVEVMP